MATPRRDRLFHAWAGVVTRHPVPILMVAFALAAAAVAISAGRWRFQSDRNLLISLELDWNRRYIDLQQRYPGTHDLIVVIDAGPEAADPAAPAYAAARAAADELGPRLADSPLVRDAVWGAHFGPRALRLAPLEEFREQLAQIAEARDLLASPTPEALLAGVQRQMLAMQDQPEVGDEEAAEQVRELERLIAALGAVLERPVDEPVDLAALMAPESAEASTWQHLTSDNGRLLFIRVSPEIDTTTLDALAPAIRAVRALLAETEARHPGVEIGLTGVEVMEADETAAATWDSAWTASLAAVVITILLVAAFHSWRVPLMAMIALLTGIAWTYGFVFLAVGHLQVLSVVFNVMLLGLGIAYGIHLASAYELARHEYPDDLDGFRQALAQTLATMGPGIFLGAVTTAGAFVTTIFTRFTGVAEMGLIAAVGVLLCLLAMFTVFPALLRLFKAEHEHVARMELRWLHFFEERWAMPFVRRPYIVLGAALTLTALALTAIWGMQFDYDLLKLQPRRAPSVAWQERIVRDGAQSIWYGVSEAEDLETARQRAERFMRQPTVGGVGGIALLFPRDEEAKVRRLEATRAALEPMLSEALAEPPDDPPAPLAGAPDLIAQLEQFQALMMLAAAADMPPPIRAAMDDLRATLARITQAAGRLSPEQRQARVERLRREFARWRHQTARQIAAVLDPAPLAVEDLPAELMRGYRDEQGRVIIEVYPRLPEGPGAPVRGPLDPRFLPQFVAQMEEVDPDISGVITQVYRSGRLIKISYQRAGVLALGLVLVMVLLDFRSMYDALLIMVPVGMAFAVTFGLMWLVGQAEERWGLRWLPLMSVNMANIIVLPLMFGIGVDSGVHVLNRFRQDPRGRPPGLTQGTGKGVTITCLTSVVGFSAMMLSSHRGIASLGFVLATGLLLTMFACWTVMPAWLAVRQRRRAAAAEGVG